MGLRRRHRSGGSAMVELVFVLPVLLLLIFGVAEFGMAFQRWQVLSNAAREAARSAALQIECDPVAVVQVVHDYVAAAGLSGDDVEVSPVSCVEPGLGVAVSVRHDYVFPVLSNFVPGLEDGIALTGTSVMRKE